MDPALAFATALWAGLLIYGAWLCIEDTRDSSSDEDAARSREQKSPAVFEHPEDCV